MSSKLLDGVKVVDLTTFVAAPTCCRLLADMGADVIKVETPKGDPTRHNAGLFEVPSTSEENPIWEIHNANKKGIAVNLKEKSGMEIFHKLLSEADVFITNTRTKALVKLGLDYESLKEKYPKLIFGQVLGYGENGPLKDDPGFDSVAFWTRTGCLSGLVKEGEYPITAPYAFGDTATGTALFGGICAALVRQAKTGCGEKVTVSLYGAGIWYANSLITPAQDCYNVRFPKKREESIPTTCPYKCKDGVWLMPTIMDHTRLFPLFCKVLGIEEVGKDERYATPNEVMKNADTLIPMLEKSFAAKDSEELLEGMREADIVCTVVNNFNDVTKDEQAWANRYLHEFTFQNGNKAALPCTPIQTAETEDAEYKRGPRLGEDTQDILEKLGYTAEEISRLREECVIA